MSKKVKQLPDEFKTLEEVDMIVGLEMLQKPVNWGVEDSSVNIDKYVYGEIREPSTRYLGTRHRKKH
ncbi:Uncharacterised protein [uncultured archaeon]|nr:Uncharacterised protein [uncultured archaeon]